MGEAPVDVEVDDGIGADVWAQAGRDGCGLGAGRPVGLGPAGACGAERCEHRLLQGLAVVGQAHSAVRARRREAVGGGGAPAGVDLEAVAADSVGDDDVCAGELGRHRVAVAPHRHQSVRGHDPLKGQRRGERGDRQLQQRL